MPALLLILLFIVVPIAELAVIIQVGQAIGVLPTIAILLVDSVLGAILLRTQGRAAWRRFRDAVGGGRVPHRETVDGALVIFGGALLLTPGFMTDVLGLVLLVPPTRAVFRRLVARMAARRMLVGVIGLGSRRGRGGQRDYDVEGTAHEADGASPDGASRQRIEP